MAKAINNVYSNLIEIQNNDDDNEESELIDFDTFFIDRLYAFGFLFTHTTSTHWVVIFANTPHYDLTIDLHHNNHISITITRDKLLIQSFSTTSQLTGVRANKWDFKEKG
jgi:hypothetical protein